jgi:hypothetical protein
MSARLKSNPTRKGRDAIKTISVKAIFKVDEGAVGVKARESKSVLLSAGLVRVAMGCDGSTLSFISVDLTAT